MTPGNPLALDWFVVECGGDGPSAALVQGLQHVADYLHSSMHSCGGMRWIDCDDTAVKNDIQALFSLSAWTLDSKQQPFRWHISFEEGYIKVVRVTSPLPKGILSTPTAAGPALHFTVPLLPPSVNHYKLPNKGGGYRISKDARAFMDAVPVFARAAAPAKWPWDIDTKRGPLPFYEVDLIFHIHRPSFLKGDSDNLEKVAFDALTGCGAITDDRYIKYHTNRAFSVALKSDERTEYTVRIVEGPR